MNEIPAIALFRLSVLGPLVSRERLVRGELKQLVAELARREYAIPGTKRHQLGAKTIEAWYYAWRHSGIDGLAPKPRRDRGCSRMCAALQEAVLAAKRDNPRRSMHQILRLVRAAGLPGAQSLSRSALHRLLQRHGLSRVACAPGQIEERRSFAAEFAGSIWYGDVMHGPRVPHESRMRRTYLVSLLDDASRLVAHSAFCLGETALDIEGVLKQALLKRGVPLKLVVDNGAAYRSNSLQGICARLSIHLVYCRPYAPEGKGKLERWHRTLREQFLAELDARHIADLADLNARLWAWIEQVYHHTPHTGLDGCTPLARYQRDLPRIRCLGARATQIDALFHHRIKRLVRKDGTVSYEGQRFEVPYECSGKKVRLVVDAHAPRVLGVEDEQGRWVGAATALDLQANVQRRRHKPNNPTDATTDATTDAAAEGDIAIDIATSSCAGPNLVELAHARYYGIDAAGASAPAAPANSANSSNSANSKREV